MGATRNKIGFKFYNEQEVVEEVLNPIEHINTVQETQTTETVVITPAHKEVLERIELVKSTIKGAKFSSYSEDKKQEFLNELVWLTEINTQLTFSY